MANYKKTIAQNRPEYLNKTLLLTNSERSGLFALDKKSYILIKINNEGELAVNEITDTVFNQKNISLRKFGETCLNLNDPSVNVMLKYLVTPEMEVERIFNNLRYKYLQALYFSRFDCPKKYINASYNKSFQTLAGLTVYQGNTKQRKDNDAFWKEAGFKTKAKEQNWEKERTELQNILSLLKQLEAKSVSRLYAELIAIKPGFHELFIHDNYFDSMPKGATPRDKVFRMLRNKEDISALALGKLPKEINKNSYFSYAPCNVTEGPFVFRKGIAVSYFDKIRKIRSKKKLHELTENFHILDYYHEDISSHDKLGRLLERAKFFCKFITGNPNEYQSLAS